MLFQINSYVNHLHGVIYSQNSHAVIVCLGRSQYSRKLDEEVPDIHYARYVGGIPITTALVTVAVTDNRNQSITLHLTND